VYAAAVAETVAHAVHRHPATVTHYTAVDRHGVTVVKTVGGGGGAVARAVAVGAVTVEQTGARAVQLRLQRREVLRILDVW